MIPKKAILLIKQFEGFREKAYLDGGHVWTIGYGRTRGVYEGMTVTQSEAQSDLMDELVEIEGRVTSDLIVRVNDNELSALLSFVYNVGVTAFRRSTLLKLLNRNERERAADEFLRWNKDNGKTIPGLTRRRLAERALFLTTVP